MNKKYAQGKKAIIAVLTLAVLLAQSAAAVADWSDVHTAEAYAAKEITFSDVNASAWYYDNITTLVGRGVINGYQDGTFKPDNNITRAEFTKLVITALGSNAIANNKLPWPDNVIAAADEYRINLYGSDAAAWNEKINRADMAQIAMDAKYRIRGNIRPAKENMANVLKDRADVENSPRKKAILEAMSLGILNGNGTDENGYTYYLPNNNTKRSEAATIIMNMLKYLGDEAGELNPLAIPEKPAVEEVLPDVFDETWTGIRGINVVNPVIAREKDLEALKAIRCGKDDTGYWVKFTAPELPQTVKDANFKFRFYVEPLQVMGEKGVADIWTIMDAGESRTFYFKTRDTDEIAQNMDTAFAVLSYKVQITDFTSVLDKLDRIKTDPDYMSDWEYYRTVNSGSVQRTISVNHQTTSGNLTMVFEDGRWTGFNEEDKKSHRDNHELYISEEDAMNMFGGLLDIMIENGN